MASQWVFLAKFDKAIAYVKAHQDEQILLKSKGNVQLIHFGELIYVEVRGHTLLFHTQRGLFSQSGSLKNYEERLSKKFLSCVRIVFW